MNFLYTLIGSNKIYSDKEIPIKNVNQSLIDKVFEDSTSKFLGSRAQSCNNLVYSYPKM
ncbi:hypothetical protein Hanom_Chr09g00764411 [Helianthus anomalus]